MSEQRLLEVMADGNYHSGEELGELLGVSRTAVWKQIKKLESLGLGLESVKGKGYCLRGGLDLLNHSKLLECLGEEVANELQQIEVLGVTDSTNARAMQSAQSGLSRYVCVAEQQTAGRGRRGKVWQSPYGCNLYFSVVWSFDGGASVLEGLSLAVGVAVVRAMKSLGIEGLGLKWPNDILFEDKKLAGILLEMTGDAEGPCQLVAGVGINVSMPEHQTESIDQPWVNLSSVAKAIPSRNEILASVLTELVPVLLSYEEVGFGAYRDEFMSLDAYVDKPVYIKQGAKVVLGQGAGVDVTGALLLDTDHGRQVFNGGEVSLRRLSDT